MAGNKLTLSKPISAHDEKISELTFREPTGDDLMACGEMPFALETKKSGATLTHISTDALALYIERLAGIPMSSVKQMTPKDFMGAFGIVAGFFGDTPAPIALQKQ